jgi:outer membrane protein
MNMQLIHRMKGLLLAALLLSVSAGAQQKHNLSVKDAVELAYKNVPDLKNKLIDYRLQEAKNKEITGSALPQLSAAFSMSKYLKLPLILFPDATESRIYQVLKDEQVKDGSGTPISKSPTPVLQQVSFQQPWNASAGATLTQLLYQPDVMVGLQARKTALEYATADIEVTKEKVKLNAYTRYYAILIAEKQLSFIKESVKRAEKLLNDNNIMFKNGFIEKLDIDKAQVLLNNLNTTKSVLENGISLGYAGLKFALGVSQKDTLSLKDSLSVSDLKAGILDEGFKYEDRKEILLLGKAKRLQELDLKRNRLGYYPTVSAFINYSTNGQGQRFVLTDRSAPWLQSSLVGLNVNVPIFDGFQRKYKIQQSRMALEKTENTFSNIRQGIDLEQTIAKESLKNAILNLDIQQRNIDLARSVYNTTKKKFEQGLTTSFDILQAETALEDSESKYFDALYNAIISKINFMNALGKLQ